MTRAIIILAVCLAAVGCNGGTTKVVNNNTVAQKFAAFNKSGWSVTGGGVNNNQFVPGSYNRVYKNNPYAPKAVSNPLGNAVWSTNFRVDAQNGARVAAPANVYTGVNLVGQKGPGVAAAANNSPGGITATGPNGSGFSVAPASAGGGMSITGPAGTGAASVNR